MTMKHPAWWLVAALLAGAAWALDPPGPAPAQAPASQAAEQAPGDAQPEDGEAPPAPAGAPAGEELPAAAPEARSTGPTPQRFDPSEKVRADFPVSFPIDI
jgi:hypothetical protein